MKLCMPTSSYPLEDNDTAGVFLRPLVRMWVGMGVTVEVVAPQVAGRTQVQMDGAWVHRVAVAPPGVPALFHGAGAPTNLRALGVAAWPQAGAAVVEMARAVLHARADVVLAHWVAPAGAAAALARMLGGPRFSVMAHGSDLRAGWPPGFTRRVGKAAHARIVPAAGMVERAGHTLGGNITVLPLPVDMARKPAEGNAPRFDVGVLCRLVDGKGVDVVVDACARAGLSLAVGGDGPQRAVLEARAAAAGGRVWFAGPVLPSQRAAFLARLGALAVPSVLAEGRPAVLAEAAACNVGVVGSDAPGVGEALPAALVVARGDVAGWAQRLEAVNRDETLRDIAARWCRQTAAEHAVAVLAPRWLHALL